MPIIRIPWIRKFETQYHEVTIPENAGEEDLEAVSPENKGDNDKAVATEDTGGKTESENADDEDLAIIDTTQVENESDTDDKKVSQDEEPSESGVSQRGRVLSRMINYISNESKLGESLKTGELRKRMTEPAWNVPAPFNMTHFDMGDFSMKLLSAKENPDVEHVILQLHGGGYMGAIRNAYYVFAGLYNEISHGMSVLSPDYRVAPENPYPAALNDAISSYKWLMERGYKPENIVLAGDSAGGGLSLALCMYLRDHDMPTPGGIIAMSPWTDLTASGPSYDFNYDKDPLYGGSRESLIYINAYPGDNDKKDPYISPAFGKFDGFPPMLIQVGSHEMLLSDSETVAAKAREAGVKVRLTVYEGMFHDFQMAYTAIPESKKAWAEAGRFLDILYSN